MRTIVFLLTIALSVMMISSCSGGRSPITTSENQLPDNSAISQKSVAAAYPGVFGAWKVTVDIETLTAEIIPARNASAIGNTFDADLSQFLMVSPCHNCLAIGGIEVEDDELLDMDIYMRHPFADISKRPDLHGFDVRAIFLNSQTYTETMPIDYMKLDGGEEDIAYDPWFLLNADGFTSHFDELVLDQRYFIYGEDCPATINPYLRFFDDPQAGTFDPAAPVGYNVMPVGSGNDMRTAVFYATGSDFTFYIIADVAFGQSAVLANRTNPQYYLPEFNRTEPWRVEYWIENNILSETDANSTADLVVQVFDWQHNATVDPAFPNPANPSGVKASSKVTQVILSMPQVLNDNVVATVPESGDGSPSNPLKYRLQVKNEKLADFRVLWGIIAVRDEMYGAVAPSGRVPIPVSPAGFPYETQDIRDYSYYGNIYINLPDSPSGDPKYGSELWVNYEKTISGSNMRIDAEFFMDPSHEMFQYELDYDYDGVTFDVDGTGLPSDYFPIPEGKTDVGLRVRTNTVPPMEYVYTIPVYKPGVDFDNCISDDQETFNTTSRTGSNSIAVLGEKVCVAYTANMTGNWEIYTTIYDGKTQTNLSNRVTTTVGSCYDPSVVVIEDGPNPGLYLVFANINGSDRSIMSNYGNPYAGGFSNANIKTIATISGFGTTVNYPCLVYNEGVLTTYYHRFRMAPTPADHIRVSQSLDYAQTWSSPGNVDGTTDLQTNPSAVYCDYQNKYYVVWDDGRNDATRGRDLYLANSSDGITFGIPENISTTSDNTNEEEPSMGVYRNALGIAYLQSPYGSDNKELYLKVINVSTDSHTTAWVDGITGDQTFTPPSIGIGTDQVFVIGYGKHDFSTDENIVKHAAVYFRDGGWFWKFYYDDEPLGVTSTEPLDPRPAVVCKSVADGYGVQSFITHRSFRDGADEDTIPFTEQFGYVDIMSIITYDD
jgi:hypothetical protein